MAKKKKGLSKQEKARLRKQADALVAQGNDHLGRAMMRVRQERADALAQAEVDLSKRLLPWQDTCTQILRTVLAYAQRCDPEWLLHVSRSTPSA